MKIGSLFSGYGGLEMGVQQAIGGTVAWHSEFDANPSKILAHRWPTIPNYGDITAVRWTPDCPNCGTPTRVALADEEQVRWTCPSCFEHLGAGATGAVNAVTYRDAAYPLPVQVLTGGFPCQDVSHAGRRRGLFRDGEGRTRSGLWGEMLRAIDTLRPGLVVAENVRGLLSAPADSDVEPCPFCMGDDGASPMRALGAVLADLADIGYDAAWVGLPASGVGAPHGRFRVFILAWPATDTDDVVHGHHSRGVPRPERGGSGPAGDRGTDAAPLTCSDCGHLAERHHYYSRCDATPNQPESCRCHRTPTEIETAPKLLPSPRTSDTNGPGHHGDGGMDLRTAVTLLPTPRAGDGEKGGPNQAGSSGDLMLPSAVQPGRFGEYAPAITRWENVLGRPAPAPTEANLEQWERRKAARLNSTLPVGMRGSIRFIVDGPPHRLSPRFVEWMMGLPVGHVTNVPDLGRNAQLKALGNGVVPQQAAAAVRWLLTIREHALAVAA